MRSPALVFLAACSGGVGIEGPREAPVLRLVECTPAQPLFVEVDGRVTSHARLDGDGMGWAASAAGRPQRRAASVSFGMPQTGGMVDAMMIRRTLNTKVSDLQRCFAREMEINPGVTRIAVSWWFEIASDGRVPATGTTATAVSGAMIGCLTRIFHSLVFPPRSTVGQTRVVQPLVFDSIPISERPPAVNSGEAVAWTPFAIGAFAPARAASVARATQSALRGRTPKLEACFASRATGSLRAVMGVQSDGSVATIRAGGIGDAAVETCVEKELAGVKVVNPLGDATEIACDFARGDAQPWRVTPAAPYGVVVATKRDMTYDKQTIAVGALEPDALPANQTYLIVADPETPGAVLANALAWTSEGDATLVALRDGRRAPVYLGMGRVGHDDASATRPVLMLGKGRVQACLGNGMKEGKLAEAGPLALRLAARCKATRCGTLVVGMDDLALAKDLPEVTGAARRAGFDRVLIGGRVACTSGTPFDEDAEP